MTLSIVTRRLVAPSSFNIIIHLKRNYNHYCSCYCDTCFVVCSFLLCYVVLYVKLERSHVKRVVACIRLSVVACTRVSSSFGSFSRRPSVLPNCSDYHFIIVAARCYVTEPSKRTLCRSRLRRRNCIGRKMLYCLFSSCLVPICFSC